MMTLLLQFLSSNTDTTQRYTPTIITTDAQSTSCTPITPPKQPIIKLATNRAATPPTFLPIQLPISQNSSFNQVTSTSVGLIPVGNHLPTPSSSTSCYPSISLPQPFPISQPLRRSGPRQTPDNLFPSSPIVTVLDESKLSPAGRGYSPRPFHPDSTQPENMETDNILNLVQGPTMNENMIHQDLEITSTDSPRVTLTSRQSGNTSPITSIVDCLGESDLAEVLAALQGDDSQDVVVNKLVAVINDLVENTELNLDDIVELMKSSIDATTSTPQQSASIQDMIKQRDQVLGSMSAPSGMTGIILPPNWVPVSLNSLTPLSTNTPVRKMTASHPYKIPSPSKGTPPNKTSNICNTCSASFSQFSSLLRHIRQVHQKIKDKPCPICGERFARSQYLPNHIWRTHYNRATTDVKCFFCPEILNSKEGIQQHLWLNHVKARR